MPLEQNQLPTPSSSPDLPAEQTTFDDGGNASQSFTQPAGTPPKETAEDQADAPQWKDDKRGEIFARAREKRAAETQPFSGDPNDPDALYGNTVDQSDMGDLPREAMRRKQEHLSQVVGQPPDQPPPQGHAQPRPLNGIDPQFLAQPVPIIVDGVERLVPVEDLVRNYQIDQAATKRLEYAKALVQQTQSLQQHRPHQPGAEYEEPSEQDDSARDTDELDEGPSYTSRKPANVKDLVEKIQLGSPDEAADALQNFIESAVNRAAPVDETTRVLTALEDHNSKQAVLAFAEQNPQIASNPTLQIEATKEIHRGMAEDLLRAGYTMQQLRELAPSPQHLTQLHKQARIQRLKGVRPVSDLIAAGYQGAVSNLRSLLGEVPAPSAQHRAPQTQQRQERKESLQPQPAARRLSPSVAQPSQNRSQDQSRQAAVARIRQSRGQPV